MRRLLAIFLLVVIFYWCEYLVYQLLGRWMRPNLLIILIIFVDLCLGIRYSLFCGFWSGLIKDGFSVNYFGLHIISFMAAAFLSSAYRRYYYQKGSDGSRVLMVLSILSATLAIQFLLQYMIERVNFWESFRYVYVPEISVTVLISIPVLRVLRKCALKYFV